MYTKVYIFIHVCGSIEGRKGECLDPRPLKIQKIRIYVVKFWKICLGLPQTNWNTSRPPHPSPGKKLWIRECTFIIYKYLFKCKYHWACWSTYGLFIISAMTPPSYPQWITKKAFYCLINTADTYTSESSIQVTLS